MSDGPDWVEQARRLVAGLGQTLGEAARRPGEDAGHPADCRWCPVCQVAAVVRGERPEVTAALADVLGAAATALRSFAEQSAGSAPATDPAAAPTGPAAAEETAADPDTDTPAATGPAAATDTAAATGAGAAAHPAGPAVPQPAPVVQRIEIG